MRLATPESVLSVLGIQSGAGALTTAGVALDATFPNVESMVDSGLLVKTRIDTFDIGKYETEYPTLRLTSGFLNKDEPVVVSAYGAVMDGDTYRVDYANGTIALLGVMTVGKGVVEVQYTHGYELDTETNQLIDIPDALMQGGILAAASFMMLNPANVAKEKARFMAGVTVAGFDLQTRNVLAGFLRPRGTVVWPCYTEVVE